MQYDFDKIINRYNTDCEKWDMCKKRYGREMLPLWVADMDFESPPAIKEALIKRASHGVFGYTYPSDSYYGAIINWMRKKHGWNIKKEWILTAPGVLPAISLAVLAFTKPGDPIVIQSPVYHPFRPLIENNGRKALENTLKIEHDRYVMDLEHLEKLLSNDRRIRMMILCNPHNPVGRVWKKAELEDLADICIKHQVLVLSDEIHSDLIMPGHKHTPFAMLSKDIANQVVTCTSVSKTFNLAALACANIIISDKSRCNQIECMLENISIKTPNLFGLVATQAGYTHGDEWLEQLLVYLKDNYDFLLSYLDEHAPQLKATPLEGTHLAWVDFRNIGLDDTEIRELLHKKARIWSNHGPSFGSGGQGFQRINIACPKKILEDGLKKITNAVNEIN